MTAMTRKLSTAERMAQALKDATLEGIVARSEWDLNVVEQAVLLVGYQRTEWSCNDLRDKLPEQGHGFLGAAINGLRTCGLIERTGQMVPSTSTATHGHGISVWRLTVKGLLIAQQRAAAADASVGEAA